MNQLLVKEPDTATRSRRDSAVHDDAPSDHLSVTIVRDAAALRKHLSGWMRLVETAVEPNVFYEPHLLLPAIEQFGADRRLEFALGTAPAARDRGGPPVVCGLFPLERQRGHRGLPVETIGLWKHKHCFLCTPLVRADVAAETLAAFFGWVERKSDATLFCMRHTAGEGPFHLHVIESLRRRGRSFWVSDWHPRAMLRRADDADSYVRSVLRRKRRIELERLERRLAEQGPLEYEALADDGDLDAWLDDFLTLEATGWKGRNASAIACSTAEQSFFRQASREAFELGRFMMLRLRLAGRTIAAKCNFLARDGAGDGGFAFKIAFDEEFARYSPGVLLELENIRQIHARPNLRWMDSCAVPDHPMINRLWRDRRSVQTIWTGASGRAGDWFVAASPLVRHIANSFRRAPASSHAANLNDKEQPS